MASPITLIRSQKTNTGSAIAPAPETSPSTTAPERPRLIVSLHDVAPATLGESRRWTSFLDQRGIPATLLAVPGPWRGTLLPEHPETIEWLWVRQAGGDEIGLHGWCHRAREGERSIRTRFGRCVARGTEEFWTLDGRTAARRVRDGLDILRSRDLEPVGFTPPGWLIGPHARHAVRACGLEYIADHRGATAFDTGRRVAAPALSHRPGGFGERAGAIAMGTIVRRRVNAGDDVRVALHPADLSRRVLVDATLSAIDHALQDGAVATTYRDALGLGTAPGRTLRSIGEET